MRGAEIREKRGLTQSSQRKRAEIAEKKRKKTPRAQPGMAVPHRGATGLGLVIVVGLGGWV